MKKTLLTLTALSILIFMVGCDPFGTQETFAYMTGTVYTDPQLTIPAEGVAIELVVSSDSSSVHAQTVFTNTAGVFFMEIQFYPSLGNEESGTGYTMPNSTTVGLTAHYGGKSYEYKSLDDGFVLATGDTLTVWSIDLTSFTGGSGGGTP